MITQSQVKELFTYKDGNLYWINRPYKSRVDITKPAGTVTSDGYRAIMVNKKYRRAHRLVYMYHYGFYPETLDHRNNDRLDNSIDNLRPATYQQNNRNASLAKSNTSGVKGVSYCKQTDRWKAAIRTGTKNLTVGRFDSIKEAEKAIIQKRKEIHGNYANNGRVVK